MPTATDPALAAVQARLKRIDAGDEAALPDAQLLRQLKLLTTDGKLNQDARRKLKQILHLTRQIWPFLEKLFSESPNPQLIDAGAGKAYFGFILADLVCRAAGRGVVTGIESRPELIAQCRDLASRLQLNERLKFVESSIEAAAAAELPAHPDMICALHACDTATDDAIVLGLKHEARYFALVPCCQAEVAQSLKQLPRAALWPLWRHPIQGRDFGSHLTNVIRSLVLESRGYKVTVTEFTGWEHSLKNELIMAEKIQKSNPLAQRQLDALRAELPVEMGLLSRI